MRPNIYKVLGVGLILVLAIGSCTDLSENPPSLVTNKNFFNNTQQFVSALGSGYSHLSTYTASQPFNSLNETSSDEMVVPQRGKDWFDGGTHIRLQRHTWTVSDPLINGTWTFLFGGVSITNRLVFQFKNFVKSGKLSKEDGAAFIAEIKALKAFYYYWLLDMYGNVPIVKSLKEGKQAPPNNKDFQTGRDQVFKYVESLLKNNIKNLSRAKDQTTFARMNVWAAHFLLAKLYLNAKVYTNKARWKEALAQCDSIINSGKYSLATNYFASFADNTQNDPEMIMAIPFDAVNFKGNQWQMASLHYENKQTFNLTQQPYNGYATLEDFYNSFSDKDVRKQGFLEGYQYSSQGDVLIDLQEFSGAPHGDTLFFTPHINELQPRAFRKAGVRFNKYKPDLGSTLYLNNDVPVMRYADVLLMKAECLWRLHENPGEALHLVNMVRERAGIPDYTNLNAYKILAERGRELYIEEWRRQDLIRFSGGMHYHIKSDGQKGKKYQSGKTAFNDAWRFKKVDQTYRNVFPIPEDQRQANSNLTQNPGYSND
jgi:hypothetical protein